MEEIYLGYVQNFFSSTQQDKVFRGLSFVVLHQFQFPLILILWSS